MNPKLVRLLMVPLMILVANFKLYSQEQNSNEPKSATNPPAKIEEAKPASEKSADTTPVTEPTKTDAGTTDAVDLEKLSPSEKVGALTQKIEDEVKRREELEKKFGAGSKEMKEYEAKLQGLRSQRESLLKGGLRVRGKVMKDVRRDRARERESKEPESSD